MGLLSPFRGAGETVQGAGGCTGLLRQAARIAFLGPVGDVIVLIGILPRYGRRQHASEKLIGGDRDRAKRDNQFAASIHLPP